MMTRMKTLVGTLVLFSCFAACGADAEASADAGSIVGHWSQETGSDKKGMTLEFDAASDELTVHTAPAEDGTHRHLHGTYAVDAATGAVTVKCAINGEGNGDSWQGKLDGEHLSLTAGDQTLRFHKRGEDHGHDHDHGEEGEHK